MTILRTRFLVLLLFLVVCLTLTALHRLGPLAPVERFVVQFIVPVQHGVSTVAGRVRNIPLGLGNVQRLRRENQELRAEVEALRALVITLRETESENRLLRDQLGFIQQNPALDLLPANVIGRDPESFIQTIMVNRGTSDGVREGKVVVAAARVDVPERPDGGTPGQGSLVLQGLVGRVVDVGPNYARVLLISDLSSAVNVYVQGSQAEGLLVGQGQGAMMLKYVRQGERLAPGMAVLTSGLGGAFPRALAAGIVMDVEAKDQATFQTAHVMPLVDLSRLNVVFIIRSFDPIRLGS